MGIFLGLFKRYAKKKSQVPTLHQWGLGEVQNGIFFQKTGPKSPHHEEKKNLKLPYVDNRFQNYDLHSRCKGNSKFSVFPLSPLAKFSQALWRMITKVNCFTNFKYRTSLQSA